MEKFIVQTATAKDTAVLDCGSFTLAVSAASKQSQCWT